MSGGRAVIHGVELTYSITCNETAPLFSKGIYGSYRVISRALSDALKDISVEATICIIGKTFIRQCEQGIVLWFHITI